MKTILTILAVSAALFAIPGLADHHMNKQQMHEWDERQMEMHNDAMEKHLEEMQGLMNQLHDTNDPAERRSLLDAHRKEMKQMMHGMRSSQDDMIMGMMGGGARHGGDMPEGERKRQYMIEKRLDMMNQMMEMMMERDQMMMQH